MSNAIVPNMPHRRPTGWWPALALALVLASSLTLPVLAQKASLHAGLRMTSVPGVAQDLAQGARLGSTPSAPPIPVALYYPTSAPESTLVLGPFTLQVAMQAAPEAQVKGLILLSHGTGGSELGHSQLALALARAGYLVAALRHPGDNWQDRSLLLNAHAQYFDERPRQASLVLDALLRDPEWAGRIPHDAQGPRIGALGHSAGGYTVLALAGAAPDLQRLASHCTAQAALDPIFCGLGARALAGSPSAKAWPNPPTNPALPKLRDARVRAVVALSPLGAVFSAASLAAVRLPALVVVAEQDRYLVPRFHADWITANLPGVQRQGVPNAWHFAFMDPPSTAIPTEDGDVRADPPSFDRQAYLRQLGLALPAFFDQAWH